MFWKLCFYSSHAPAYPLGHKWEFSAPSETFYVRIKTLQRGTYPVARCILNHRGTEARRKKILNLRASAPLWLTVVFSLPSFAGRGMLPRLKRFMFASKRCNGVHTPSRDEMIFQKLFFGAAEWV